MILHAFVLRVVECSPPDYERKLVDVARTACSGTTLKYGESCDVVCADGTLLVSDESMYTCDWSTSRHFNDMYNDWTPCRNGMYILYYLYRFSLDVKRALKA